MWHVKAVVVAAGIASALSVAACVPPPTTDRAPTPAPAAATPAADAEAATMLGGQWMVQRIGELAYPSGNSADIGIVHFQSDEFFSHEAGCGGGHPAFYAAGADGTLRTWRREAVVIAKCSTAAAPELERTLARFVDQANAWAVSGDGTLTLTATDGTMAELKRRIGPVPDLEGDWRVVSVAGAAWKGPKPASVSFAPNWYSASAGCNSGGAQWSSPKAGRLVIGSFASTQMRCEPLLMEAEASLLAAAEMVTGYRLLAKDKLQLTGPEPILLQRISEPPTRDR
ncbi:hypothetical protein HME9302_02455 [Alteripontixanthobacter maritimus]|uniref:DUF306 domain-containing protein n=1 Tax=Alteripontixanthobacter maritimus TaxID=2161824 RepID=A0A369QCD7_9SPHN|nr:META domain-containing protein [Alteripontixanthobacter maritimus]RDC61235.1 hypothetical protein HME9302_02455 [Alteripontixanthobacter maritimus]